MAARQRLFRRFRDSGRTFEICVIACAFIVLLWLKLVRIDAFAVVDEPKWAKRATAYYTALAHRDFPATFRTGHPGVVTLWIGTIASGVQSLSHYGYLCEAVTIRPEREPLACALDEKTLITHMHIGVAFLTWVMLVVCYLWLRRLYGFPKAGVILALLAFEPFLLAHSRLAHLEGILAHALLASCLALLSYEQNPRKRLFVLSAVLGGMAVAEKLPGLYIFAVAAFILMRIALRRQRNLGAVVAWAKLLALWSVVALAAVVVLWPALWSAPGPTAQGIWTEISSLQTEASSDRHLIFGQTRGADSAPLLYLGTLLFKLTPFSLVGLIVGCLFFLTDRDLRRDIGFWLGYAAGFIAIMSMGTKQGGRYILSAFPAVDIIAGLAFWRIVSAVAQRIRSRSKSLARGAVLSILALNVAYTAPLAPYFLASFNWLLGGPRVASRYVGVGLGEGLDQAARYLNEKPEAERLVVATAYREAFAPYFLGKSFSLKYPTAYRSDYLVFYINQWQRRPNWTLWRAYHEHQEPEHVVEIHGIRYAEIYANRIPEAAIAYVKTNAARDDLVLAELPSLFTRHYQGEATLWLPPDDVDRQTVLDDLQTRMAQHKAIWWVIYPEARGDYEDAIAEAMRQRSRGLGMKEFGELRVEHRVAGEVQQPSGSAAPK